MNTSPSAANRPTSLNARITEITLDDAFPYTAIVEIHMDADDGYRLHPSVQDQVSKFLAARGPVISQTRDCVRLVFGTTKPTDERSALDAHKVAADVLAMIGLADRTPSRFEVRDPTLSELAPVLVGLVEAASILGVSRQRAAQLAKAPGFPVAIARLRATPVWFESEVRAFTHARRQRLAAAAR